MPDETPPPVQINGYSLLHYAIVAVPSKSKKATKTAQKKAETAVVDGRLERHVMESKFSRSQFFDNVHCEMWIVSYVRPASKTDPVTSG